MPYTPPHKRIPLDPTSKPTPCAPPSFSRHQLDRRRKHDFKPELQIQWSPEAIRRFKVVPESLHGSVNLVQFVRFDGETFAHLQNNPLYTLRAATAAEGSEPSPNEVQTGELGPSEDEGPASTFEGEDENKGPCVWIVENMRPDLITVLGKFRSYLESDRPNRIVPTIALRFGRLLFKSAYRSCFDWDRTYPPQYLEKDFERGEGCRRDLQKTFDNCLSPNAFISLEEIASRDVLKTTTKEKYIIEVEDDLRPNTKVVCVCSLDETPRTPEANSDRLHRLVLKKIKLSPVRHMVADIACVGKSQDLRLTLFTEEHLIDLTEEEKFDLGSLVSKGHIDENVKGGIHWPLGSTNSILGRYKVVGSWQLRKTTVKGATLKWKLQHANRAEFKASSGRISYEVDVKPAISNDYLKGRSEWNQDNLIQSIEELLIWVWVCCI